jgi:drug/metabolite transporter (DMT)-like permease
LVAVQLVRRGPWISDGRTLLRLAASGLLGVTLNQSLFLYGLAHSTAVNATILVTTVPVFTVLGSLLLGQERPSKEKLIGIGLAAIGAIYLVGPDRLSLAPGVALGNLSILLGMICYAAYFLVSKPLLTRHDPITVGTYVMIFASIGVAPLALPALAAPVEATRATWWLAGYIVLGPTVAAYFLNLWALRRTSSNTVAAFVYLQPFLASVVAPMVLPGETMTARTLVAGLTIFVGLGLVIRAEAAEEPGGGRAGDRGVLSNPPPPHSSKGA